MCEWRALLGGRKGRVADCAWCGERLCSGCVGARQCAGQCSLGKRRVADGCKQRLVFKITAMRYHSEKQLWHHHFCYRRRGSGWGTDPRREWCPVIPHQAPQAAQPGSPRQMAGTCWAGCSCHPPEFPPLWKSWFFCTAHSPCPGPFCPNKHFLPQPGALLAPQLLPCCCLRS